MHARFECAEGAPHARLVAARDGDPTNHEWSDGMPDGSIQMHITHPEAQEMFTPGAVYKVTFEAE